MWLTDDRRRDVIRYRRGRVTISCATTTDESPSSPSWPNFSSGLPLIISSPPSIHLRSSAPHSTLPSTWLTDRDCGTSCAYLPLVRSSSLFSPCSMTGQINGKTIDRFSIAAGNRQVCVACPDLVKCIFNQIKDFC